MDETLKQVLRQRIVTQVQLELPQFRVRQLLSEPPNGVCHLEIIPEGEHHKAHLKLLVRLYQQQLYLSWCRALCSCVTGWKRLVDGAALGHAESPELADPELLPELDRLVQWICASIRSSYAAHRWELNS